MNVGDIVVLRSGGPPMYVLCVGERIECMWVDGHDMKRELFFPWVLRSVRRRRFTLS